MKPSPYFADSFAFFFKRFLSANGLRKFFLKYAGDSSEPFEYPSALSSCRGHLIVMPETTDDAFPYIPLIREIIARDDGATCLLAGDALRDLVFSAGFSAYTPCFYTVSGCRYGTPEYEKIVKVVTSRAYSVCLYLERKTLYQRLALAKLSSAPYRIGFHCEDLFPFLNVSLGTEAEDAHIRAQILQERYGSAK